MEKFVEFLDDAQLLRIENSIISRGEKKFGILMRKYVESKSKNTTGYVIDCFFNSIACYLNTTFSGRHGILVTTDEDVVEEFISESHAKYYTLFLGYMPNTIIKTVQMVEDKPFIVEIEFNKGDLIIVSDSIQCKFTNSTYTANKIFEVIYMNFDNNE